MQPSGRSSARASSSSPTLVLGYYIAMLEQDVVAMDRLAGENQGVVRVLISCSMRRRWPRLVPDSFGARGRSREKPSTPSQGRGLRETAAVYESAVAVWEAFSGNPSVAHTARGRRR